MLLPARQPTWIQRGSHLDYINHHGNIMDTQNVSATINR
jgi:hypothetical protein